MKTKFTKILSFLGLTFFVISFIYLTKYKSNYNDIWSVVFADYPNEISIELSGRTSISYILKQTHLSLFYEASANIYESFLLQHWSRDIDNKNFILCPKENLKFKNGTIFDSKFLKDFFIKNEITKKANISFENEKCIKIFSKIPISNFFKFFSKIENAPSLIDERGLPYGLGPFDIISFNSNKCVLKRKNKSNFGINEINVYPLTEVIDKFENGLIDDFNYVPIDQLPKINEEFYYKRTSVLLQSAVLLINIPNKATREKIYNCLDIEAFRDAYTPKIAYTELSTIAAFGFPGAKAGKLNRVCKPGKLNLKFSFLNPKSNTVEKLKNVFSDFKKNTGIEIINKIVSGSEYLDLSLRKKFDLMVIAADSLDFDVLDIYKYFADTKFSFYSFNNKIIYRMFIKLRMGSWSPLDISKLDQAIQDEYMALPLLQRTRVFYLPKRVKGFEEGKIGLDFPNIEKLVIK